MKPRAVATLIGCSLMALVLVSGATSSLAQAPTLDPRSLVGEWPGEWKARFQIRELSGRYYLKIERVEGDTVFGNVEATGGQGSYAYPFRGTLVGNKLTFTSGRGVTTELVVTGNSMSGTAIGGPPMRQEISVTKAK